MQKKKATVSKNIEIDRIYGGNTIDTEEYMVGGRYMLSLNKEEEEQAIAGIEGIQG